MKTERNPERKRPGRKPANLPVSLTVEYVPLPEDRIGAYRAGLRLLLDLLHEEKELLRLEQMQDADNS